MSKKPIEKSDIQLVVVDYQVKLNNLNDQLGNKSDNSRVESIEQSLSNKVDKVTGKSLISTTDINQITTNKNNITSLTSSLNNKVDKATGKSLVADSSITQITTNKNNIANHETRITEIENIIEGLAEFLEENI